jgi:hypothetical protein
VNERDGGYIKQQAHCKMESVVVSRIAIKKVVFGVILEKHEISPLEVESVRKMERYERE